MAWSRYRIPATPSPPPMANLRSSSRPTSWPRDVKLALADFLFSPDQLPQGYCATADFATRLGKAAGRHRPAHRDRQPAGNRPVPVRHPLPARRRWSCPRAPDLPLAGKKTAPCGHWTNGGPGRRLHRPAAHRLRLRGRAAQRLLRRQPRSRQGRALLDPGLVAFLSTTLDAPATGLRAVVAPFFERQVEEFRIGFTAARSSDVVHGVVAAARRRGRAARPSAEIEATLRACGIADILVLDNEFPMEYCDDCGAPCTPSPEGGGGARRAARRTGRADAQHLHCQIRAGTFPALFCNPETRMSRKIEKTDAEWRPAEPRGIPGDPPEGHRTGLHRALLGLPRRRPVPLRVLRRRPVLVGTQV